MGDLNVILSTEAVTDIFFVFLLAQIAAAISFHYISFPPQSVSRLFVWFGRSISLIDILVSLQSMTLSFIFYFLKQI